MRILLVLMLVSAVVLLSPAGIEPACAAGEVCPEYIREDKEYGARVKADLKRYARSEGVPERLMYLYDQLGDCPYCLAADAQHPILPYIYIVFSESNGGGHRGTPWNADEEYRARQDMRDGYVKAFYILLAATNCECCRATTEEELHEWDDRQEEWEREEPYRESGTWNEDLKIDTSLSDAHDDVDELGPDPEDLTNIDDKDRYPDVLPMPELQLPPPVRPLTTGCEACQELVYEYNDLAMRINEQGRVVAKNERRFKTSLIAIRFALREIRAHQQKAQDEDWEAESNRLEYRHGDLVATSQEDERHLRASIAVREELMAQLARLRDAIRDCEHRCRLLEDQALPSSNPESLPEPAIDNGESPLPAYARIATGACSACADAENRRNDIARDMNELVQGMIDAGINASSIKAWEALRAELEAANNALRDCMPKCALTPESEPTKAPNAEPLPENCPPCERHKNRLDALRLEMKALNEEIRNAKSKSVRGPLQQRYQKLRVSEVEMTIRLRHCRASMCVHVPDFAPDTNKLNTQLNWDMPLFLFKPNQWYFVSTSCLPCKQEAKTINDWILRQYDEWLLEAYLVTLADRWSTQGSDTIAIRYRFLEFLNDLDGLIAGLKECEQRACPDTHGRVERPVYPQSSFAPEECLADEETKPAVESGDAGALPDSCNNSWLTEWLADCEEDDCSGTNAGVERGSQDVVKGVPNDPYFESTGTVVESLLDQWGLRSVDVYDAIAADRRNFVTAHESLVAVVDSGLDILHPDIKGQYWVNFGERPGNGIDDDGNGYIDDVHGWNFVGNDNDVSDHNGHGTLVAGIIGAAANNGIGIAGANPWVKIMPIKVTNLLGRGNSVDVAAAIIYAVDNGADVINVSLGGAEYSADEQEAVNYAASKDVLVVVAAGNQGGDAAKFWPAGLDNVITVAAMEDGQSRARYSNWGGPVDIAAPGSNIMSLRARHTDLMYFVEQDYPLGRNVVDPDGLLYQASGTSFAAPFVSGLLSLTMSLQPQLEAAEVRRMLLYSATDVETPGIDALTGRGMAFGPATLAAKPEYFLDAAVTGVSAIQRKGTSYVEVVGSADADRFASAEVQFGEGESPESWQRSGDVIAMPVHDGVLGEIELAALRGNTRWTIRVVTTHQNGSRQEARFALTLN